MRLPTGKAPLKEKGQQQADEHLKCASQLEVFKSCKKEKIDNCKERIGIWNQALQRESECQRDASPNKPPKLMNTPIATKK